MIDLDIEINRGRFQLTANLQIESRITGVFGPSGSGKSTLLNVIAGLVKPDRGYLKIDDVVLFSSNEKTWLAPHKRRVGVVFQDSQLFPHMTVKQNLLYGYNKTPNKFRKFQLNTILQLLEIGHLLESHPHQLSGGEKQRVGIGRALLASPRVLLMDEPLASLDMGLKQQILPFLTRIKNELDLPLIYVSHSIEEILQLSSTLVFVKQGKIIGHGNFLDIVKEESILNLTRNLGLENILTVKITGNSPKQGYTEAETHGQEILLPLSSISIGKQTSVSIKSGEIAIARHYINDISIQNQIKGTVTNITQAEDRVLLQIDTGDTLIAEITINSFNALKLTTGDTVFCLMKAQSFHYLEGYTESV